MPLLELSAWPPPKAHQRARGASSATPEYALMTPARPWEPRSWKPGSAALTSASSVVRGVPATSIHRPFGTSAHDTSFTSPVASRPGVHTLPTSVPASVPWPQVNSGGGCGPPSGEVVPPSDEGPPSGEVVPPSGRGCSPGEGSDESHPATTPTESDTMRIQEDKRRLRRPVVMHCSEDKEAERLRVDPRQVTCHGALARAAPWMRVATPARRPEDRGDHPTSWGPRAPQSPSGEVQVYG